MNTDLALTLADCTYRQFDHWARRGYLGPDLANPNGSGNPRNLSDPDALAVLLMSTLVNKLHLQPATAAEFVLVLVGMTDTNLVHHTPTPGATITIDLAVFRTAVQTRTRPTS